MESASDPMSRVRPPDPAGLRLARARMFGALFGERSAARTFGRFHVLDRLGAGGMGVVYEAYDPDLARGVALKLVNVVARGRDAALAEAKALGRLSHPNVVPIYDVGIEDDHVYLVMELVRGKTLRDWSKHRSVRDILAVYQQAGEALAAAHRAGLVHRDFKPDNAIVGSDGRVRVVDFGLACEADDPERADEAPRRAAGTPRFMAPEIKSGSAITPAADQFSFSVALAESLALTDEAIPRRIAAALDRGRATDPGERFPAMGDLLHALAHDPARSRRRFAVRSAVAASVAAAAFLVGRHRPEQVNPCDDSSAQLDAVWRPEARATVLARIATLGSYGRAIRPLLERDLDAYQRRWTQQSHDACVDRRGGTESDALIDRRETCLARGRDAFAVVHERVEHAGPAELTQLPLAVQAMPDLSSCSNRDLLMADVSPAPAAIAAWVAALRARITEASIDVGGGRYDQAVAEAQAVVADARALGYGHAIAEALLVQGNAQMHLDDRLAAVPLLSEALSLAVASHDDALAIEAWARRAYAQATSSDHPEGALAGLDMIEPLAGRTPSAMFARALLYNNLGSVELARDRRPQARERFQRALTESRPMPAPIALELIAIRENLAFVTDDRTQGDQLLDAAATELANRLGDDHPDALEARRLRGTVTIENLRRADEVLTPVCHAYQQYPALAGRTAECWTEVGLVRLDLGQPARALEAMEEVVHAQRDEPQAIAYASLLRGDARAAEQQFEAGIAAIPSAPGQPWWYRLARAEHLLGRGRAWRALGELRAARDVLRSAIAELEPIAARHPTTSYERRLGRARVELAFTLQSMAASPAEYRPVATAALDWLRRAGGAQTETEQLVKGLDSSR